METENKIIQSFETFRKIGSYEASNLTKSNPSCINGIIDIRKYRVTVELINEPKEVLEQRLQELWDNGDNHHHWSPLAKEAKELGYELKGDFGNKRKKR